MKNRTKSRRIVLLGTIFSALLLSCSSDDDGNPPETQNNPPEAFDLIGVANGAQEVGVTPSFTWQAATDPDSDTVSYDLYLGTEIEPNTLFAGNISGTSFTVQDRLRLFTQYSWKVVAKDGNGGEAESSTYSCTTRNLNIPNAPVTAAADFTERASHTTVVFDDKLWVIAGGGGGGFKNDVWFSENGADWAEAIPAAAFTPRSGHATVVFDNKLWVIGGLDGGFKNDVWYSTDGATWMQATAAAPFSGRFSHTAAVFDNKLWVIGGTSGFNPNSTSINESDVWFSEDGINWTEATSNAAFQARAGHEAVIFDEKLWIIGGFTDNLKNDLWFSTDGIDWVEVTSSAAFTPRSGHATSVYDGKLWVSGGSDSSTNFKNDIWFSTDGTNWFEVPANANFPARSGHSNAVYNDKLWVIGGWFASGNNYLNDVWAMD
ncbi:hypothetical protein [Allomuricauda sp. d1]|uniref:Kelch repeat-containing protein n=1 Tax=Allomuricauda sp. d1 TaxID=3136725 RepID=UPI0031D46A60